MDGARPSRQESLAALQTGGAGPPLFCAPTWSADLPHDRLLAGHLVGDIPFYALLWPGADGEADPFHSIEALAAHQVANVLRAVPEGPCEHETVLEEPGVAATKKLRACLLRARDEATLAAARPA